MLKEEEKMRGTRFALVAGLAIAVIVLSACGGSNSESAGDTETTETTTPATGSGTKLVGTVGEPDNADAFTITLTTEDGTPVTTLAAGSYALEIKDLSSIHNFHLTGPGDVDVTSGVDEIEDENYDITLQAGSYHFQCDPHASSMSGDFEVSG